MRGWPWWKTAAVAIYPVGYWAYIGIVGVNAWPKMELGSWVAFMSVQVFYAIAWPVFALLAL